MMDPGLACFYTERKSLWLTQSSSQHACDAHNTAQHTTLHAMQPQGLPAAGQYRSSATCSHAWQACPPPHLLGRATT